MPGFFYFFERTSSAADFAAAGLAARYQSPPAVRNVGPLVGPDGRSGTVFSMPDVLQLPAPIDWERAGDYWVGVHRHNRPGPADLQRGPRAWGIPLQLGDGNEWAVPIVLPAIEHDSSRVSHLRPRLHLDPADGTFRPVPSHPHLIEAAERLLPLVVNGGAVPLQQLAGYCADVLAANYRIGRQEVSLLRLFDEEGLVVFAWATLDVPYRHANGLIGETHAV